MTCSTLMARLLASAAILAVPVAGATPLTWNLQNVTFTDGGSAFGSFTVDSASNKLTTWNITTTAGGALHGFHYTPDGTVTFGSGTNYNVGALPSLIPYFKMAFTRELTSAGTVNFVTSSSWECMNCSPYRYVSGGAVTTENLTGGEVPEPASLALLGLGLGIMAVRRRHT